MDSDLLETKGCKEPMENLETFSTQRSAAEGDGETPEPVLKAPRRRTARIGWPQQLKFIKWLKWFQKSQSCLLQSESNENLQKTPFSVG